MHFNTYNDNAIMTGQKYRVLFLFYFAHVSYSHFSRATHGMP